jgi:hypothetical protein
MFASISFIAVFLAAFMTLLNAAEVSGRINLSVSVVSIVACACAAVFAAPVAISVRIASGNYSPWLFGLAIELLLVETLVLHVACMIVELPLLEVMFVLFVSHGVAMLTVAPLCLVASIGRNAGQGVE